MELVRKQLNGYRVLHSKVQQFEQQTDIIIPDVNPDAMVVSGVWGICAIHEQQLRRERVTASGAVNFTLLYQPETGSTAVPLKGSLSFQEVLEVNDAAEDDLLFLRAEILELKGIILNSRKVGIQCRLALFAWVYQRETVIFTEGVQAKPEEGIQMKCESYQTKRLLTAFEKMLSVSEDVHLNEPVSSDQLLHAVLNWKAEDVRTLSKKIMVRGAVQVHMVFLGEGDALREVEYTLPFSQIVESSEVRSDCTVELQYVTTQQQLRLERREEGLFLVCSLGARTVFEVYRETDLTAVSDLYSTRYHTETSCAPLPVLGCKKTVLKAQVRETVKTEWEAARLLHYSCCGATAEVSAGKLRGAFYLSVFLQDEETGKRQVCITLREELDGSQYCEGAAAVQVQSISVTGAGESLFIELQVQYQLRQLVKKQSCQVEHCELDTAVPRIGYAPGTLLLRTVGRKESTWDLAKDYGTTELAILSANHLTADQPLEENQLVMIPFLRR